MANHAGHARIAQRPPPPTPAACAAIPPVSSGAGSEFANSEWPAIFWARRSVWARPVSNFANKTRAEELHRG
jgi:hypothetical protein